MLCDVWPIFLYYVYNNIYEAKLMSIAHSPIQDVYTLLMALWLFHQHLFNSPSSLHDCKLDDSDEPFVFGDLHRAYHMAWQCNI